MKTLLRFSNEFSANGLNTDCLQILRRGDLLYLFLISDLAILSKADYTSSV